jgi:hypothetical protein
VSYLTPTNPSLGRNNLMQGLFCDKTVVCGSNYYKVAKVMMSGGFKPLMNFPLLIISPSLNLINLSILTGLEKGPTRMLLLVV